MLNVSNHQKVFLAKKGGNQKGISGGKSKRHLWRKSKKTFMAENQNGNCREYKVEEMYKQIYLGEIDQKIEYKGMKFKSVKNAIKLQHIQKY